MKHGVVKDIKKKAPKRKHENYENYENYEIKLSFRIKKLKTRKYPK
tara:strand:+ start:52 stop:189 length:138 start_codon:yes stop_codon:yes gene_type:complete